MQRDMKLDAILSDLAQPAMAGMADRLLDFRASAQSPSAAGACVKIYFELLAVAPDSGVVKKPLAALGKWLEERLSIEVVDETGKERVERLPLRFRGESELEEFCRGAMRDYSMDRCLENGAVRMQFGLKEDASDAVFPT
jgi:hypothetical protein